MQSAQRFAQSAQLAVSISKNKLMKILIFFLPLILMSCYSKHSAKIDKKDTSSKVTNMEMDSLKWQYYVYNFQSNATFSDIKTGKKVYSKPIECDIIFDEVQQFASDSAHYYFKLVKPGLKFEWITQGDIEYFGVFNGNIVPLRTDYNPEYIVNPDSVKYYYNLKTLAFKKYLKTYNGKIGDWVKKAAIKKQIISN